jgi:uncharacterized membrane protein
VKQPETSLKKCRHIGNCMICQKKYLAIMIVCFLLGGFSIMLFIISINAGISFTINNDFKALSMLDSIIPNGTYFVISSLSFAAAIYSAAFILAGVAIFYLCSREKPAMPRFNYKLLSPDEKSVVDFIKSCGGTITQKELSQKMGIGKVRISRIISRLCSKNILQKSGYGMTNKIILIA